MRQLAHHLDNVVLKVCPVITDQILAFVHDNAADIKQLIGQITGANCRITDKDI